MTEKFRLRDAKADDIEILWNFLAMAGYEPNAAAAKAVPIVASHLIGWPRPGDFGIIAERCGVAVGVTWARQFLPEEHPTYYAGLKAPEVSIAVLETTRGAGLGELSYGL